MQTIDIRKMDSIMDIFDNYPNVEFDIGLTGLIHSDASYATDDDIESQIKNNITSCVFELLQNYTISSMNPEVTIQMDSGKIITSVVYQS